AEVDPGWGSGRIVGHAPDGPSGRGVRQVPSHNGNNQPALEAVAALVRVQVDPRDERRAGAGSQADVRADEQVPAVVRERVVLLVARARELADVLLVLGDAQL